MSQVANTYWDDRAEGAADSAEANPTLRRRARSRRLVDGIILTIVIAAAATCVSVYSRASGELEAALNKHVSAGEKVEDLTIKVEKLERDIQRLRTDSKVIELFARQKFGFVRSGDVVIKLAPPDQSEPAQAVVETGAEREVRVANLEPRLGEGVRLGPGQRVAAGEQRLPAGYTGASN